MKTLNFPFEDCVVDVIVQSIDRAGKLWGLVDVLTLKRDGHLVPPERIGLFDPQDWGRLMREGARRNSGNVDLWVAHGEEIRVGLIERPEVLTMLQVGPGRKELAPSGGELRVFTYADIEATEINWTWYERIPRGKVTIVAGDPGLGKSWMMMGLAARLSSGGRWPDGTKAPKGDVIYVSAEDGESDTIRPRLDKLGANTAHIHGIGIAVPRDEGSSLALSLVDHLDGIEAAVRDKEAVMLVLDPLLAFTGGRAVDTNKPNEVRPLLMRVAEMAERTACAVVCIMHLNKRDAGRSLYRITSSLDFTAAARSVLGIAEHPDDPKIRILAGLKQNLSARPPALGFHFVEGELAWIPDTTFDIEASRLFDTPEPEEPGALEAATDFLRKVVADEPVLSTQVYEEADSMSVSKRTLERAKKELRGTVDEIETVRLKDDKGNPKWYWKRQDEQSKAAK